MHHKNKPQNHNIFKFSGREGLLKKQPLRFVTSDNSEWHVPTTIDDVTRILDQIPPGKSCRLVGGNTGRGKSLTVFFRSFFLSFLFPSFVLLLLLCFLSLSLSYLSFLLPFFFRFFIHSSFHFPTLSSLYLCE